MATRCDCCDLETCGKAAEQRQRAEEAADRAELLARGWFPARWAGVCARCDYTFSAGTLLAGDVDGYRAECCSEV